MNNSKISIILVNYNGYEDTVECIKSIKKNKYDNYEIVIVDNKSTDNSVEKLKKLNEEFILIESDENLGFSGGNNLGIKYALNNEAEFVLLLNNDTLVTEEFLYNMIEDTKKYDRKVVTSKIYYEHDKNLIWYAGGEINKTKGNSVHYGYKQINNELFNESKDVEFASGCCILLHKSIISEVGLLPEEYFLYYEDTHYCGEILRAGFKIWYCAESVIFHKVSASTGRKSNVFQYYNTRSRMYYINEFIKQPYKVIAFTYFYLAIVKKIITKEYKFYPIKRAFSDYFKGIKGKRNI